MSTPIRSLPGLGPKTAARLTAVGITSGEELDEVGAVEAYRRLIARFPEATSLNALWGLQAALMDIHWTELPEDLKQQLREQVGRG
jgi:DNA transformation protein